MPDEIIADYPPLTLEDVRATIAYAAALARFVVPVNEGRCFGELR